MLRISIKTPLSLPLMGKIFFILFSLKITPPVEKKSGRALCFRAQKYAIFALKNQNKVNLILIVSFL